MLWKRREEAGQRAVWFDGLSDEHVIMENSLWNLLIRLHGPAAAPNCSFLLNNASPSLVSHQTSVTLWRDTALGFPSASLFFCLPSVPGLSFIGNLAEFSVSGLGGPPWDPPWEPPRFKS